MISFMLITSITNHLQQLHTCTQFLLHLLFCSESLPFCSILTLMKLKKGVSVCRRQVQMFGPGLRPTCCGPAAPEPRVGRRLAMSSTCSLSLSCAELIMGSASCLTGTTNTSQASPEREPRLPLSHLFKGFSLSVALSLTWKFRWWR